jgi:polysaccharide export outer membrane protein
VRSGIYAACVAAAMTAMPQMARAEYRLAPGDVLEISAASLPELKQRAQVDPDGDISLPFGGRIHAAGLTLSEVQAKVRESLPAKEFRRRTDEGREYPVILTPGEIGVVIAEYKPIYLNGDVSKPGEQLYRPGMTVRQAVALAGGYDIMRFRMNNPFLEQADLQSDYKTAWNELARQQTQVSRLQAELDGKADFEHLASAKTPVPPETLARIQETEAEKKKTRDADYRKEKSYLASAVSKEDSRIDILSERRDKEQEGVEADAEDLKRLRELFSKGNVPITRVVEARRAHLLASTRQLETESQLASIERSRQDFARRSEHLDDQRRLDILSELADTRAKTEATRSHLQALGEKLVYVGMVRSQLVRGKGSKPDIAVYRKSGENTERLQVTEDTELMPGDVVEIALKADLVPGAPGQ